MKLLLFFAFCLAFLALSLAEKQSYAGHKVFRIEPTSDLKFLQKLRDLDLDFWTERLTETKPIDVRVAPSQIPKFVSDLKQAGVNFHVTIEDVQKLIEEQVQPRESLSATYDDTFYQNYHTFEEIVAWTQNLVLTNSNKTELIRVGKSLEGRDQWAVRVFSNSGNNTNKPALWFDGGIHAREWISTATVVYMLGHIVTDSDVRIQTLLKNFDVYIMLVLNPDGYSYSWTDDRMWRKNRRENQGSRCAGVDLNRNWDYHWGDSTSPGDLQPCSDAYRGTAAFSEPEVLNVANYLAAIPNLQGYINFHSYSQDWMYPWGWTTTPTRDDSLFADQGAQVVKSFAAAYGTVYEAGQISIIVYQAYGSSVDWTYGILNVTYSIGVELRDTGRYGFLLPSDQIVPSGVETLDAFLTYSEYITKNPKKQN